MSDTTGLLSGAGSWSNWSGSVTCRPQTIAAPCDADELAGLLRDNAGQVRVRGTGHSFMPVSATDGLMVSLENMPGDCLGHRGPEHAPIARLNAGRSLNELSRAMQAQGLGFRNLGDIDVQTLAGATMTGTHGSGQTFTNLSGELRSARLMLASGEIVEACAEQDKDLLDAARVSLGTLGILLEAEMQVRPAYKLRRESVPRRTKDLLADAMTLWDENRHFEFFALPFSDFSMALMQNETNGPDSHQNPGNDGDTLKQLKMLRGATKHVPWLRRRILNAIFRTIKPEIEVGPSWQVLASLRETAFNEMEYHLPVDQGLEALDEVLHLIEKERREVFFPIECRMTAADTGWLSPFQGAPRISIAVHAHQPDPYDWFVRRVEPIFQRRGGRPHWGKIHSMKSAALNEHYPDMQRFRALRKELDPTGRFLNPHLAEMFAA